jgi:DNA-binding beta-propeller fold protein YncE
MRRRPRTALLAISLLLVTLLPHRPADAHPGSGIAVDDRGSAYFTDTGRGVWRVDRTGGPLTLVSTSAMHWMAHDPAGAFADAPELFGEWFGRLTPKGARPTLISCSDFPCAVGPDGNLYYAKMHGLTIVRRTPAGRETELVTREKFGVAADRPVGANGLACGGPDKALYLVTLDSLNRDVGTGEHVLYKVDLADGSVRAVARNFVTERLPADQRHPEVRPQYCRGMAVDDATGDVYVAVTGSRCVMKVTPKGQASVVLRARRPWSPTGVAVAGGGVYVLEYDDETPVEGRDWPPRVRTIARDGTVAVRAAVVRDGGTDKGR